MKQKRLLGGMSYLPKHYLGLASDHPFTVPYEYAHRHTHSSHYIIHITLLYVAHAYVVIMKACVELKDT